MPQSPSASRTTSPKTPHTKSLIFTKHVGTLQVGPQQQRQLILGKFTTDQPAKGFSVDLSPDPRTPKSVTARILVSQDDPDEYELTLHVANFDNRAVAAEIWQI